MIAGVTKWRNKLSAPLGHFLIDKRQDDVFIAAYPRSGSTWLRTMVSAVVYPDAKVVPEFFNSKIPAVSIRNAKTIRRLKGRRIIMTHSCWRHGIDRAIYMVRDGRDALVSYYHYNTTRMDKKISFDEFFSLYEKEIFGITWERHVDSWLRLARTELKERLLVVKFEEMRRDTADILEGVCRFLNLYPDTSVLTKAIQTASLENMRKIERNSVGHTLDPNAYFYRGGSTGQWKQHFNETSRTAFERRAGYAMELAGYTV